MIQPRPTRRGVVLGGLALGGLAVTGLTGERMSHVDLYSETVALRGDGRRVLVAAGRAGLLVPGTRVLGDGAGGDVAAGVPGSGAACRRLVRCPGRPGHPPAG